MSEPQQQYEPIPVSVARIIGENYRKDCILILAYDHASEKTHATTWGRGPSDKEGAVHVRDKCLKAIGCTMDSGTVYEDYRREGEAAQNVDRLEAEIERLRVENEGLRGS